MQIRSLFYISLNLLLSPLLVSCDSFLDVNSNPNSPTAANLPLEAKLPAALVSTVNQETGQINEIGTFWGGYWGTNNEGANQYFDLKTYNGPAIRSQRDGIPVWENGYNNIPFDQAATGNENLNPEYEPGQQVYRKSLDLITEGIAEVTASQMLPTTNHGDVLFNGDKSLWARFGNTVKLRALIRQSEKGEASYIASEIQKITSEGSGFLDAGTKVVKELALFLDQPFNQGVSRSIKALHVGDV